MGIDVDRLHNTMLCETTGHGLSYGGAAKHALQIISGIDAATGSKV